MKINYRFLITGVIIVSSIVAAVLILRHQRAAGPAPEVFAPLRKVKGPDNAPVKIVEYTDFECPACRAAKEPINEILKNYPGKIQLTFRHFPLSMHKWSIYAHQAAECMNLQGKFWPCHDKIYDNQLEWSVSLTPPLDFFARTAKELGANMELFNKCMQDETVRREIYAEKEAGSKQQITATPTFLIGPQRFVGPKEVKERMENVVRKALGLAEKPVPVKPAAVVAPATIVTPQPGGGTLNAPPVPPVVAEQKENQ